MEDLPLDGTTTLVPAFAMEDLRLGRTLIIIIILLLLLLLLLSLLLLLLRCGEIHKISMIE